MTVLNSAGPFSVWTVWTVWTVFVRRESPARGAPPPQTHAPVDRALPVAAPAPTAQKPSKPSKPSRPRGPLAQRPRVADRPTRTGRVDSPRPGHVAKRAPADAGVPGRVGADRRAGGGARPNARFQRPCELA